MEGLVLRVKVVTTDGVPTDHTYPLPLDGIAKMEEMVLGVASLVKDVLKGKSDYLPLHHPIVLYRADHVMRVHFEVSPEAPDRVKEAVLGLDSWRKNAQ